MSACLLWIECKGVHIYVSRYTCKLSTKWESLTKKLGKSLMNALIYVKINGGKSSRLSHSNSFLQLPKTHLANFEAFLWNISQSIKVSMYFGFYNFLFNFRAIFLTKIELCNCYSEQSLWGKPLRKVSNYKSLKCIWNLCDTVLVDEWKKNFLFEKSLILS